MYKQNVLEFFNPNYEKMLHILRYIYHIPLKFYFITYHTFLLLPLFFNISKF